MKHLCLVLIFVVSSMAQALVPKEKITEAMAQETQGLDTKEGWDRYIGAHPQLFSDAQIENRAFVATQDLKVKIDDKEYTIGVGARSVFIKASPKVVVSVVDDPHHFQALYGLDKPADTLPINDDGTYQAHIFKLVPGIETQDFTLTYKGRWQGDIWFGTANLVKDEKDFALRSNVKIVEPHGDGSIYREVALFYPLRWWMNLLHGTVQNITKSEMTKLNTSLLCASEKVQGGQPISDELCKQCFKEASK